MHSTLHSPEEILRSWFGYDSFRGQQKKIIDTIVAGKDAFVLMPTGGGKSLCYQVPALVMPGTCLVISPLIALMKDQVQALRINGIEAAFLNSSLGAEEEYSILQKCGEGKLKLLYTSPERALLMPQSFWKKVNVNLIAVDEAHCVSQWGHDFRKEYTRIGELRANFPDVSMVALTATADKLTRKDILTHLGLHQPEVFISSFDRPNLSISVRSGLRSAEKNDLLFSFLAARRNDAGIIYCISRKMCEVLSGMLFERGIRNAFYHAGMESVERARVQDAFLHDEISVVVATIAFGMGIDKSNVRWVVHYNLPRNMESYYQEIGRAGRDGLPGDTLLLYGARDLGMLGYFATQSAQPELQLEKLHRMQYFAESRICRKRTLLSYFGEKLTRDCGNCDVCLHPPRFSDHTKTAQLVFTLIERCREQLSLGILVGVLRGSNAEEIRSRGFHLLQQFGAGRERPEHEWRQIIYQLTGIGYLEVAYDDHHALRLNPSAQEVLAGKGRVQLAEIPSRKTERNRPVPEILVAHQRDADSGELFEALRKLRLEIAREEKVAPYIVFHDKSLREMCDRLPLSESELRSISGLSDRKMEKYGERFLSLLREWESFSQS